MPKTIVMIALMLLLGSPAAQASPGKEYPTKAIEILCPYPPGSSADIPLRLIADAASKQLGQPVVVINQVGAGGSIAATSIFNAPPDGYKLIALTQLYFSTIVKTQKIPFNPNDIIPIANFIDLKSGLLVKGNSPWKSVADMMTYARENPDKLRWAHVGRGTSVHMNGMLLFRKAGVKTIDVPYAGAPEELAALLGGHVDAVPMTYSPVMDQVKAGNVKYLLAFSDRRYSDMPNIPSAVEAGYPEAARIQTLYGIYVHKNTPDEVRRVLFNAFKKTSENLEAKKAYESIGVDPMFGGPEFVYQAIKRSEEVSVPILKELGLYVGK